MALPIIAAAAAVASRIAAKKIAQRAVGGIVGKGAKNVNPVYRNTRDVLPDGIKSNAHPKLNYKVSSSVKVVPSDAMKKNNANFKPSSGATQAKVQNTKPVVKNPKALKAANRKNRGN